MTYTNTNCNSIMKKSYSSVSRTVIPALILVAASLSLNGCKRTTGSDRPDAPASLEVTAASQSSVILTWIDASDNETGFVIEMDPFGPAGYSEVATVAAGVTTCTVIGLDPDDNNRYRVYATGAEGSSDPTPARLYRIYGVTVGHIVEDFSAEDQSSASVALYDFEGDVIMLNFGAWT
ncbi:fibronectin type III domain-containing protein [Gemmatimonadota bacterium]